jgi:hypothetical protein
VVQSKLISCSYAACNSECGHLDNLQKRTNGSSEIGDGSNCTKFGSHLWCCPPKHHHFCIAIIGRAVLPAFLISLVKMLYLVIGTTLQDRILIVQKSTKLLILSHCQIGRGSILLDLAGIQPPRRRLNNHFRHKTLNRVCTSTGRAFFDHWIINIHCLEGSY